MAKGNTSLMFSCYDISRSFRAISDYTVQVAESINFVEDADDVQIIKCFVLTKVIIDVHKCFKLYLHLG